MFWLHVYVNIHIILYIVFWLNTTGMTHLKIAERNLHFYEKSFVFFYDSRKVEDPVTDLSNVDGLSSLCGTIRSCIHHLKEFQYHDRRPSSVRDLWWKKWRWDRFSFEYVDFPCLYHSTNAPHTHLHLQFALARRTKGRKVETFIEGGCCGNLGALDRQSFPLFPPAFQNVKLLFLFICSVLRHVRNTNRRF